MIMLELGAHNTASFVYISPIAAKSRALNTSANLLVSASIVATSGASAIDSLWVLEFLKSEV